MEKNQLIKIRDRVYRILAEDGEHCFIIDCIRQTMPEWRNKADIVEYQTCSEEQLKEMTGEGQPDLDTLDNERRSAAFHRYTIISGILPYISDDRQRLQKVREAAEAYQVDRKTVRTYLCRYLAFQTVSVLAPKQRGSYRKELTKDEKNFRWAINKYYYSSHKDSLRTAYEKMLQKKYCDERGQLVEKFPSFHQVRYFYSKYKKMQSVYISREGMKAYQRNYRPLLGDRMSDYA